jgi:hypothetical protein
LRYLRAANGNGLFSECSFSSVLCGVMIVRILMWQKTTPMIKTKLNSFGGSEYVAAFLGAHAADLSVAMPADGEERTIIFRCECLVWLEFYAAGM